MKASNSNHSPRDGRFSSGPGRGELRESKVPSSDALREHLGLESDHIYADYAALAQKHPDIFADSHEAKAYVEYVLARPTHVVKGNEPDHKLIIRSEEDHKAVALEIEKRGGKYRVRSAHTLTDKQLAQKINAEGPGAKPGVSRVDPPLGAKTPSRLLSVPRDTPPTAIQKILARMGNVNGLTELSAITDDAAFTAALSALSEELV